MNLDNLLPGQHVAIVGWENEALEARMSGLQFRDTLLLLLPGPSAAMVLLFRKPIREKTVAEQMASSGTGGLNIGACRVGWGHDRPSQESWNTKGSTGQGSRNIGQNTPGMRAAYSVGAIAVPSGRWPSNLALVHTPDCVPGTARVRGHRGYPNGPGGSSSQLSQKGTATTRTAAWEGYADAEGMETVPSWTCSADCPVGLLDKQSGVLSTHGGPVTRNMSGMGFHGGPGSHQDILPDRGGASRFYPQFASVDDFWDWVDALLFR